MQYLQCQFARSPKRFTYHNDTGVEAEVGDKVDVETDRGVVTIDVVEIGDKPGRTFQTKGVLTVRKRSPAPDAPAAA